MSAVVGRAGRGRGRGPGKEVPRLYGALFVPYQLLTGHPFNNAVRLRLGRAGGAPHRGSRVAGAAGAAGEGRLERGRTRGEDPEVEGDVSET